MAWGIDSLSTPLLKQKIQKDIANIIYNALSSFSTVEVFHSRKIFVFQSITFLYIPAGKLYSIFSN